MNQISRQKATSSVDKDLFKLLNNMSYGYPCRGNLDNFTFEPIGDEVNEISYMKKYNHVFDKEVSSFVNCELIKPKIQSEFNKV